MDNAAKLSRPSAEKPDPAVPPSPVAGAPTGMMVAVVANALAGGVGGNFFLVTNTTAVGTGTVVVVVGATVVVVGGDVVVVGGDVVVVAATVVVVVGVAGG